MQTKFVLHNIIKKCTQWQKQLYNNFVDFENTFNSMHRDYLWCILYMYVSDQLIKKDHLIKSFGAKPADRIGNNEMKTGLKQGCVTSTLLFKITMN